MIDFFQNLNPVKILNKEMILVELEDINQVLFIESGYYDIGFEINKKSKYVIRRSKSVIGHFELSFDKRSYFNMRVYQDCEGFFIRKRCWKSLSLMYPQFFNKIKLRAVDEYFKLWLKVNTIKKNLIEYYSNRNDYEHIIALRDDNIIDLYHKYTAKA